MQSAFCTLSMERYTIKWKSPPKWRKKSVVLCSQIFTSVIKLMGRENFEYAKSININEGIFIPLL